MQPCHIFIDSAYCAATVPLFYWLSLLSGWGIRFFAHSFFTLSLKIAHFKERPRAIRSLEKSHVSDSLVNRVNCSKIRVNRSKNSYFLYVFDSIFPFFAQEQIALATHLLKATCPICWRCSLLKSDRERFAQVACDKRAAGVIRSFSRANRFFTLPLTKNERITQKTDEQIPNPAYTESAAVPYIYFYHQILITSLLRAQKTTRKACTV